MPDLLSAALSNHMEDYLEAIYEMQREHRVARVRDIAKRLKVKMPSVSGALKALKARELVNHESYGYVTLTPRGEALAEQVYRRHQAIVGFLQRVMDIPAEQAELEACGLEHALSTEALQRLVALTEFMQSDEQALARFRQHLAGADAAVCETLEDEPPPTVTRRTLDQISPGTVARIVRVCGQGPLRRRLLDMGLRPGAEIKVERLAPLGDPVEVTVMEYHLTLRREEASSIEVVVLQQPLSEAEPGSLVRVIELQGPVGRKRRLQRMGLEPDVLLEVQPPASPDTVSLKLNGNDLQLAEAIAQELIVRYEEKA